MSEGGAKSAASTGGWRTWPLVKTDAGYRMDGKSKGNEFVLTSKAKG
jgi:hypothetical protein